MFFTILIILFVAYHAYHYYKWRKSVPNFANQTIFITGGSSGIGETLTKKLVELGARKVIIASRNIKEMERVKSECVDPSRVEYLQMDLSRPQECLQKVEQLSNKEGFSVDIVINNAGVTMREEFINAEFSTCEMMMNTNCMSHIAITKGFLPKMIK